MGLGAGVRTKFYTSLKISLTARILLKVAYFFRKFTFLVQYAAFGASDLFCIDLGEQEKVIFIQLSSQNDCIAVKQRHNKLRNICGDKRGI